MGIEALEKRAILDQGNLDRLGNTGPLVAFRKGSEKIKVIDYGARGGKSPEKILPAKSVNAVLDPNAGVILGQHRSRQPDQPNAAMGGGSRIPNHIQHCPTSHGNDKGMTAEPLLLHQSVKPLDCLWLILAPFAPR